MRTYRPDDAILAGVCAEIARRLGWNVWAIRALFLLGLAFETLAVGVAYVVLAIAMGQCLGRLEGSGPRPGGLVSSELGERGRRIEELERRFTDLERNAR